MKKVLKAILGILAIIIVTFIGAAIVYCSDYYPYGEKSAAALISDEKVTVTHEDNLFLFDGKGKKRLFIFYPGAKVAAEAYAPLMKKIAEGGVDCVIVDMPSHIALFSPDEASAVMEKYHYEKYYIGGHSLGGVVASSYAADHPGGLSGVILLAAYPAKKISDDLPMLSVTGSEDDILKADNYNASRQYWPALHTETTVDGGNHANFGDYGEQEGDGKALITAGRQRKETAEAVLDFTGAKR